MYPSLIEPFHTLNHIILNLRGFQFVQQKYVPDRESRQSKQNRKGKSLWVRSSRRHIVRIETISSFETFRCNIKTIRQKNIEAYIKQIVMVRIEYLEELWRLFTYGTRIVLPSIQGVELKRHWTPALAICKYCCTLCFLAKRMAAKLFIWCALYSVQPFDQLQQIDCYTRDALSILYATL